MLEKDQGLRISSDDVQYFKYRLVRGARKLESYFFNESVLDCPISKSFNSATSYLVALCVP